MGKKKLELKEENRYLKAKLAHIFGEWRDMAKLSDFLYLIFAVVVYFGTVKFILGLAKAGIAPSISSMSVTSESITIAFYLISVIVLYGAGIFVAMFTFFDIFREEFEYFVDRLGIALRAFIGDPALVVGGVVVPKKVKSKKKSPAKKKPVKGGKGIKEEKIVQVVRRDTANGKFAKKA